MSMNQPVHAVVEGSIDEAVVRKLFAETGIQCGTIYPQKGRDQLLKKLPAYNQSARFCCWFAIWDLDQKPCPPSFRDAVIRTFPDGQSPGLQICIAVRAVEAWFMADRGPLARHLSVPQGKIPVRPEAVDNPKRAVVDLARQSRSPTLKDDVVPSERSGRSVGRGYTTTMIEFVQKKWCPVRASHRAPSLDRALACCRALKEPLENRV